MKHYSRIKLSRSEKVDHLSRSHEIALIISKNGLAFLSRVKISLEMISRNYACQAIFQRFSSDFPAIPRVIRRFFRRDKRFIPKLVWTWIFTWSVVSSSYSLRIFFLSVESWRCSSLTAIDITFRSAECTLAVPHLGFIDLFVVSKDSQQFFFIVFSFYVW